MRITLPKTHEESRFAPLEPGTYEAKIYSYELKTSKTNTSYIAWTFKVVDPPEFENRQLWYNTPLSETALGFLSDLADAIGETWEGLEFEPDDWLGSVLTVLVEVEQGQNGPRNVCKPIAA